VVGSAWALARSEECRELPTELLSFFAPRLLLAEPAAGLIVEANYEVQPIGGVEGDPEAQPAEAAGASGRWRMAPSARVIRVIPPGDNVGEKLADGVRQAVERASED
jgi:hypothetical protein